MYFITCIRGNRLVYIWANLQDLEEWSVSENICYFPEYSDARYVADLLLLKKISNLSNIEITNLDA